MGKVNSTQVPLYYREQRGSFVESMKTIRPINSIEELGEGVEVKNYGYDNRLKSPTQIVLQGGAPIGFITLNGEVSHK